MNKEIKELLCSTSRDDFLLGIAILERLGDIEEYYIKKYGIK